MKTIVVLLGGLLIFAAVFPCAGQEEKSAPRSKTGIARELDEIARVATVMVDGDVCQRIMTKRALEFLTKKDPKDPYVDGDNFEVNHEPYIQTKKTLIRLAKLAPFPADVNLWMPLEAMPGRVQVLIRNVHEMSQFWRWGALHQELIPEMRTVIEEGKRVTVTQKPGWVSVLAPVYNSLGDIVGLVEAVSQENPVADENVK